MTDEAASRKAIPAAAQAALWTLSNGQCYYPHCLEPVVKLARQGVYRKNVQIAHIHGVKPGAARYRHMSPEDRDGFGNLMLMCTAHHAEIDNVVDGAQRYPAELLRQWKIDHEGQHGQPLEQLGQLDLDRLGDVLAQIFTPPADRLNAIADQLERTGADNRKAVQDLRQVAAALAALPPGADPTAASRLAYAAEVFESLQLKTTAKHLLESAGVLGSARFARTVDRLHAASQDR